MATKSKLSRAIFVLLFAACTCPASTTNAQPTGQNDDSVFPPDVHGFLFVDGQYVPRPHVFRKEGDGEDPRQPWILVHADEVDLNKDKIISRAEIVGEATQAFAGYDANKDGSLTADEYAGRGSGSRSAMGGFIRGHAKELDRDGDGVLTKAEVVGNAERMFGKLDRNRDDEISAAEMQSARRQ